MKLAILLTLFSTSLFAGQNHLSGLILADSGLPVVGAAVYAHGKAGTLVTVSDLKGSYRFAGLQDGTYKLEAWLGDQKSENQRIALMGGSTEIRDLEISEATDSVSMTLKVSAMEGTQNPTTVVLKVASGKVAGAPIKSAAIRAELLKFSNGEYEIVITRPGSFYVGTCLIWGRDLGDSAAGNVLHTSGMEISGDDYVQALQKAEPVVLGSLRDF